MSPRYRMVVTDLDNTLYDWVTYFAHSFSAMVDVAVGILEVEHETLLSDLKVVHQRHHNTEQPFALLESAAVLRKFPDLSRTQRAAILDAAFHAFNRVRDEQLQLYSGVEATLKALRAAGITIVAHTEATVPNALFRLRKLGIESAIERLYAVEPSGDGHPNPEREHELRKSDVPIRYLAQGERKPDPQVLLDICADVGVRPEEAIYVGDSVSRDIGMAKAAGVASAFAKYGTEYDKSLWDRLVRVTHWTAEDVQRAENAREKYGQTEPDFVLSSFDGLLPIVLGE